ncbi:MAG: hypothetical protein JW749_12015 [Sedimentisphaerales bacterium]|nr:hypothetical protein [Sedimentisphaerales bacterium]
MKTIRCYKPGFTLIELTIAIIASFIIMLTVALLVYSGQKSWTRIYNKTNSESQVGVMNAMIALGAFGRKSNKMNYRLYNLVSNKYQRVVPATQPEEVVIGDAVEFRYWNTTLEDDFVDNEKTATSYAFFYLDNGDLRIDFGPYPPGAINNGGVRITNSDVTTVTLIRNIAGAEFSHTTRNMAGDGKGCIRMKLTVTDPETGESKVLLAATLMRNAWP